MRLHRGDVLAYRAAVHDLERRVPAGQCRVLDVGVQDTPPGTTADLALGARLREAPSRRGLALVHSVRGTMHVHRARDLPLLASALRPDHAADLLVRTHGRFFADLSDDLTVGAALDEVADAMAGVMGDGESRTKSDLSSALNQVVSLRLRPWCPGCKVHHVHDGLFRLASLPAGLRLVPQGDGSARFVGGPRPRPMNVGASRRELTRRFLRICGPATERTLAAWLGLTDVAARRWWGLVADETEAVTVDGLRLFTHRDDLSAAGAAAPPTSVHLLPPNDPWVEVCHRGLLVPGASDRKRVWRAAGNPGLLVVGGEIVGTWRRRQDTITVSPLPPFGPDVISDLEPPAGTSVVVAA